MSDIIYLFFIHIIGIGKIYNAENNAWNGNDEEEI